jgi:hypothetical protein
MFADNKQIKLELTLKVTEQCGRKFVLKTSMVKEA